MATVNISTIEQFYDLVCGQYGYGSSNDFLEVHLQNNINWSDHSELVFQPQLNKSWYIKFYGHSNKIQNLYYIGTSDFSIFHNAQNYGTATMIFKDLILEDMQINTTGTIIGVLARVYAAQVENIHISGTFTAGGQITGMVTNQGSNTNEHLSPGVQIYHSSLTGTVHTTSNSIIYGLTYAGGGYGGNHSNCYGCTVKVDYRSGTDVYLFGGGTAMNCAYQGKSVSNGNIIYSGAGYFNSAIMKAGTSHIGQLNSGGYMNLYADNGYQGSVNPGLVAATEAQLTTHSWLRSKGFSI